ncbi:MAG: endonuclease/exonuclease/phosphatase family protein [Opitutaceae bacterium]
MRAGVKWFLPVLALGLATCRAGSAVAPAGLRIATYNIENYVAADRMTDAGFRKGYPKPEREKAALRKVVRDLAADVLVLQEMGPRPYLEELRRDLRAEGLDYPHSALASAADADRHIAILSRRPLLGVQTHDDLSFAYLGGRETVKRGLLEAVVETPDGPVTVFALHLKSRLTERDDDPGSAVRRAAEATAVRDRVLVRCPDPTQVRFVVLGDCNDGRNSRAAAALQRRGKTEIATLLSAADSRGEAWTHAYRREESYSRVDLIFVSAGLLPWVDGGAARIHDAPEVRAASDHRPVFIDLRAR